MMAKFYVRLSHIMAFKIIRSTSEYLAGGKVNPFSGSQSDVADDEVSNSNSGRDGLCWRNF